MCLHLIPFIYSFIYLCPLFNFIYLFIYWYNKSIRILIHVPPPERKKLFNLPLWVHGLQLQSITWPTIWLKLVVCFFIYIFQWLSIFVYLCHFSSFYFILFFKAFVSPVIPVGIFFNPVNKQYCILSYFFIWAYQVIISNFFIYLTYFL